MKNGNTPVYLIPENSPEINEFRELFKYLEDNNSQSLTLNVHEEFVLGGEVMMLQQLLGAMQHFPQIIEQMILGIELKFTEIEDSEIYLPESYWKTEVKYYSWFNNMFNMPIVIFFLHDEDSRFYCLCGDMLADQSVTTTGEVDRGGRSEINFSKEQAEILVNRLFNACWLMMVYCHASGFDPKSYIEAMIATFAFDFDITYENVYDAYKKDIEGGLKLRMMPNK